MKGKNNMRIVNLTCEHMPCDEENYKLFAHCIDSTHPVFGFALDDKDGVVLDYYKLVVASSPEKLTNRNADMWDSGIIKDTDTTCIRYDGKELESRKTYYFAVYASAGDKKVRSEVGSFTMGLLYSSDWKCGFIGLQHEFLPKLDCPEANVSGLPAPYFRKCFTVRPGLIGAKAYASAFGIYELYINGENAGAYKLAPEWTEYKKSLQYQYYDITNKLCEGENCIGAIVGDGWFKSNLNAVGRNQYGDNVGFMMNLALEYEDGSVDYVLTDNSWKASSGGVLYSDNQNGEYFDARLEDENWCKVGFDDSAWHSAVNTMPLECSWTRMKASIGPQVKENIILSPINICHDKNGAVIVDMGQNMVGYASLIIKNAEVETKLTIRHGEMLKDDGTLYTENLRSALQTDTYICKGGIEKYQPRFTFHGFRYLEISGLGYMPEKEDIQGHVIFSACRQTGTIETGSPLVNKLFSNALWGQRGNFVGIPTDCPQRDERLGWTGDTQIFCRSACYNMDCYGFFDKYMEDLRESQKPTGSVTDIVPMIRHNSGKGPDLVGHGNAAWGDAVFIVPYTVYSMYGDLKIIAQSYDSMTRYFKFLLGTTVNLIRPAHGYGDWLSIDDTTPLDVLSTAYFAYDAYIMAKCAKILCRDRDYEYYADMFERIREAWCDEFVSPDVTIKGDTQCCYVLALKMKLLPVESEKAATEHLVRTIQRKNYHLSTGFVGVSYLLPVLCDHGYSDIAYRLLLNDTYPSWGYSIKNGATTIWERWNSYTKETGFGDVGMNSFNHYSLGSVVEWMYSYMGGIKPLTPGFREFAIKPYFSDSIGYANVTYNSACGKIVSNWKSGENGYTLKLTVPANTKAYLAFPPSRVEVISGKKCKAAKNYIVCSGGEYEFLIK